MNSNYNRLRLLAATANDCHARASGQWTRFLDYARQAGEALNDARQLLGYRKRGRWMEWVKQNFRGSYETVKVYRRIANHWDDPRLQAARDSGISIDSIAAFDRFIRSEPMPTSNPRQLNATEGLSDRTRSVLRQRFASELRGLKRDELYILECQWDEFWLWMYKGLKRLVIMDQSDYYGGSEEEYDNAPVAKFYWHGQAIEMPGVRGRRRTTISEDETDEDAKRAVRRQMAEHLNQNRRRAAG